MSSARYIFRMDDITPRMDWGRFEALLTLLRRFRVKPLLGVIPDNCDESLNLQPPRADFWEQLRNLARCDAVDIAQHGYQHRLTPNTGPALIGPRYGVKELTEFAGLPLSEQLTKIQRGQEILRHNGLDTKYWMAPNHSFDRHTLLALRSAGFTALTDGVALFPTVDSGLICIPQQLWKPRWMPTGVITVCLHSNEITTDEVAALRAFLRQRIQISSFSAEVLGYFERGTAAQLLNAQFRTLVATTRTVRSLKSWRRRRGGGRVQRTPSSPAATSPFPPHSAMDGGAERVPPPSQ
jgi:predicted deacetylase